MAEYSGFFASVGGDRNYDMAFLAKWISSIIGNGVYSGNLGVAAGSAMTITIPAGQGWINGYYYQNNATLTLSIAAADGVLNRIDTVVLRWDVNTRSITAQVLKGTAASTPVAPSIVRSTEQYDLKLAEISIPAGTIAITAGLITDTRLITSVCGIVTGVVSQVDATTLYNQIQGELATFKSTSEAGFTTWFNTIKGQLTTDAAGSLQTQITNLPATASPLMDGVAAVGTSAKLAKEDHRHATDTTRAPLASPAFTGTPTFPTATAGTNNTTAANTAFVAAAIAALAGSAPATLDTLNELAIALGNDPNFATTITNLIASKAPLASPTMTGTPSGPTAALETNTTQFATTAFVMLNRMYKRLTTGTTLSPEVQYDLGTYTSALSVTLSAPADTTVTHEYCFAFKTGASGYSLAITVPSTTVKWMGGTAPTLAANKSYQVNVKYFNNGTVTEWHATAAQYG